MKKASSDIIAQVLDQGTNIAKFCVCMSGVNKKLMPEKRLSQFVSKNSSLCGQEFKSRVFVGRNFPKSFLYRLPIHTLPISLKALHKYRDAEVLNLAGGAIGE